MSPTSFFFSPHPRVWTIANIHERCKWDDFAYVKLHQNIESTHCEAQESFIREGGRHTVTNGPGYDEIMKRWVSTPGLTCPFISEGRIPGGKKNGTRFFSPAFCVWCSCSTKRPCLNKSRHDRVGELPSLRHGTQSVIYFTKRGGGVWGFATWIPRHVAVQLVYCKNECDRNAKSRRIFYFYQGWWMTQHPGTSLMVWRCF